MASVLLLLLIAASAVPGAALAEQASAPTSPAAARLDAGGAHNCVVLAPERHVRCWGFSADGQLGYGNRESIGDNEAPGSVGPVDLGAGRGAAAVTAGGFHSCAVIVDATVRCWGSGTAGQLGYGTLFNIGDDEAPGSVPPVDVGAARTAIAITAGTGHTCTLLDGGDVRCWGAGNQGRLGYPGEATIGDDETPASAGPVDLGEGRRATAISAGGSHTCALLDGGAVRCWGRGLEGELGAGNRRHIGDDEAPGSVAPVDLGEGRSATAITAGGRHTCALLDGGDVRCWGSGLEGQLGYASTATIGDDETPGSVPPADLGPGRRATAISAGDSHTCALLDDGTVRCWGSSGFGELGYGNFARIGDDETPGSIPAVSLGAGRTAVAIGLGGRHTCALLDDGSVRCWGYAGNGRLGYCSPSNIGDNEPPSSAGPVALTAPLGGGCGRVPGAVPPGPASRMPVTGPVTESPERAGARAEAARLRGFRACRGRAASHIRREIRRARRLSGPSRTRARRHIGRHRKRLLRACLRRYGRTPGRVTGLEARAVSSRKVVLRFKAPGTDGEHPPPVRSYLVTQSRRPIRGRRGFRRAQSLCGGSCRFSSVSRVGDSVEITVTDLRPRTTYYYEVAARDNVSRRLGPRTAVVSVRTP